MAKSESSRCKGIGDTGIEVVSVLVAEAFGQRKQVQVLCVLLSQEDGQEFIQGDVLHYSN